MGDAVKTARRRRTLFLWISAVSATAILLVANEVLLPFILGIVAAYILLPAVLRVERLNVPRWIAILLVYAVTLGAVAGFIALIVPSIASEGRALSKEMPHLMESARTDWLPALDKRLRAWTGSTTPESDPAAPSPGSDGVASGGATSGSGGATADSGGATADASKPSAADDANSRILIEHLPDGSYELKVGSDVQFRQTGDGTFRVEVSEQQTGVSTQAMIDKALERGSRYVSNNTVELLKLGQKIVGAISRGVFNLFMTLMLGGYMMLTHEKIIGFFRELVGDDAGPAFDRLVHRLDRGLSGVLRGQLLICVVNGVLSAIGFWLFDLKYWPLMALIAAIGSLIPIFGSILATIPAVAIGLTQSPSTALAILGWVVGIHQIEANFLNPKIIGDAAKIHPVLVVFSLLVGEHFFQIKGALFAVPCLSLLQTFFLHFRETTMGLRDPTATMHPEAPPRAAPASDPP